MGKEQIKAASLYLNGKENSLSFESFSSQTEMTTYSADSDITDSAASATAMATGQKVNNRVISMELPGDGSDLETLLEYSKSMGKSVGLVTTTHITHATPAAFGAHTDDRENYEDIADDYLFETQPHVLFGGGGYGITVQEAESAGYTVIQNKASLASINIDEFSLFNGQFGEDHLPYQYDGLGELPELSEMAEQAFAILAQDTDGFFLLIEGGRIDHAGHSNDLIRNIYEVVELADTVQQITTRAKADDDTLIIVTADHETGGLEVLNGNGIGTLPSVTWSTTGHTNTNVPVYAKGPGSERFDVAIIDNTDIFSFITELFEKN